MSKTIDYKWIRITGKAVMDQSDEAKKAMFETLPALEDVYSYDKMAPYYFTDMKSVVYSFDAAPVILED